MKQKILFRADGNSATGLGHLYRLFSLVEMIKNQFDVVFLTSANSTHSVIREDYKKDIIPETISIAEEPKWLFKNYNPKDYAIVADGYAFNSTYQKQIKDKGYQFMYIDDLAEEHIYADIVVNHSPYLKPEDYKKEAYTHCFLGTQYAMLRPAFLEAAKNTRNIDKITSVFVCFGGADPLDLSSRVAKTLLESQLIEQIHIVLGAAYKHKPILELQQEHPERLQLYKNLSEQELADVMNKCHLGIAPSSTILYELCCIKMPVYSGYYVDNQKYVYQGFLDASAIIPAGNLSQFNEGDFKNAIKEILYLKDLNSYVKQQQELFDETIKSRFQNVFNQLAINVPETRLRVAKETDLMLFFEWANDSVTRQMSFHKDAIPLEDHKKWFANQINSTDNLLLVMEVKIGDTYKPAGQVKFDDEGIIGIALDANFRGQKLGALLITEGLKYVKLQSNYKEIIAYIKKSNVGSVKVFKKAGFVYSDEVLIRGEKCYKYICNL